MPVDLYHHPRSPPCMAVKLVAAAVDVELNLKLVDLDEKDHLKSEFLKINPQHTLPTMVDDGFILWESRAICSYLVEKYGKTDSFYPKDPKQRAIVNQRLYFDLGTLFSAIRDYFSSQYRLGAPVDPAKLEKCHEALDYLDKFLEGQNYVAGSKITIADLVIVCHVVCFTLMDSDLSRHKNTSKWLQRVKNEVPKYNEVMDEGIELLRAFLNKVLKK